MASLLATKLCSVLFHSPPSVQAALPSNFCVRFLGLDPSEKVDWYINTDKSLQSKFAAANPLVATHVFGEHGLERWIVRFLLSLILSLGLLQG